MIKKIVKMLLPSEKKIAEYATEEIAKAINNSGKEEMIAKYSTIADQITGVQAMVTRILVDGKISEDEKKEIAEKLEPLFRYLIGLI